MSVVRKASLTIDTDTKMKRWNNKLFKNGARPGAVLTSPSKLDEKTAKRVLQGFDESFGSVANAFTRIFLDDGMEVKNTIKEPTTLSRYFLLEYISPERIKHFGCDA